MLSKIYQPNQLTSILDSLFKQNSNGVVSIETQADLLQQRSCKLILREGAIVYGGTQIPNAQEFCRRLGEALKPNLIKAALSVAVERAKNPHDPEELLEMLIRMRAFTWQEVEALMNTKVLLILDKFVAYPGKLEWQPGNNFDFALSYGKDRHGLNWTNIQTELKNRQRIWENYAPQILSMDAIPHVSLQQQRQIDDLQVKDHFRKSVDGKRTLVDIAEKMGKDPLKVAKNYANWVNKGWVSFSTTPVVATDIGEVKSKLSANLEEIQSRNEKPAPPQAAEKSDLPIVLSVDDSAIVQISIKRALQNDYQVLLANKVAQAMEILNQSPVELMLLDLTMPDVDGLEFCKTVRRIPKFQDLPIVMVTARDGLVNKMRGRIAGTDKYITKPFEPEELRDVVRQYIKQ